MYGAKLLRLVYGTEYDDTAYKLNNAGSDLWCWVKQVYGNLFSETTYLNYVDTELSLVVGLIQMDTLRQVNV